MRSPQPHPGPTRPSRRAVRRQARADRTAIAWWWACAACLVLTAAPHLLARLTDPGTLHRLAISTPADVLGALAAAALVPLAARAALPLARDVACWVDRDVLVVPGIVRTVRVDTADLQRVDAVRLPGRRGGRVAVTLRDTHRRVVVTAPRSGASLPAPARIAVRRLAHENPRALGTGAHHLLGFAPVPARRARALAALRTTVVLWAPLTLAAAGLAAAHLYLVH